MDNFKGRSWIAGGVRPLYGQIHEPCVTLNILIIRFPKTCQSSQLIDVTASCLKKMLETLMFIKNEMMIYDMDPDHFYDIAFGF